MPPGDSPFAVKFIIIIRGSNLRYAFSLHQGRAAFSDPLFVVWRCIRGRNPSKTFSTIREKCFAAMECVGMDRKIQKWSHKCYAWRSRTPVPGHNWQRWARTRNGSVRQTTNYWRSGKLSANLAIVLPMKSSTIDMAFIKFVQDGSQNNSRCCINKRNGHLPQNLDRYDKEGDAFMDRFITGDETWVHHYEPEYKRQSMEWKHPK